MWLERFVIIVTGQHRGFLPATWFDFHPTLVDASTFIGSVGLFLTLFLLFVRFVPIISMNETKELAAKSVDFAPSDFASLPRNLTNTGRRNHSSPVLLARFPNSTLAANACRRLTIAGIRQFDAHAPFADGVLKSAIPTEPSPLPWITFVCGLLGGLGAFAAQRWVELKAYPMQIGGKPGGSWQAFIPITFEVTILSAAIGCFVGLWVLCALPNVRHALLSCRQFESASDDAVFVTVDADDPRYSLARGLLRETGACELLEVEA